MYMYMYVCVFVRIFGSKVSINIVYVRLKYISVLGKYTRAIFSSHPVYAYELITRPSVKG